MGLALLTALCLTTVAVTVVGAVDVLSTNGEDFKYVGDVEFIRDTTPDEEEYSEDSDTLCPVGYTTEDEKYSAVITYTYEEWEALGEADTAIFRVYEEKDGDLYVVFNLDTDPTEAEMTGAVRNAAIHANDTLFTAALSLLMIAVSCAVVVFFGQHFTMYEKCWFLSIMVDRKSVV